MKELKTALVTGASDGIGLALAAKLLDEGFQVIATSRSGKVKLNSPDLFVVKLDVLDVKSIDDAARIIREKYQRIHVLVNNAGVGTDLGTSTPERSTFQQTIQTNVTGLVFFAEEILPMIADGGQVLNISSKLGSLQLGPHINSTAYRMSKAALNMYTSTLAERLRSRNITVVSVHPGWVETKLSTKGAPLTTTFSADEIYKLIIKDKPSATFWNVEDGRQLPW